MTGQEVGGLEYSRLQEEAKEQLENTISTLYEGFDGYLAKIKEINVIGTTGTPVGDAAKNSVKEIAGVYVKILDPIYRASVSKALDSETEKKFDELTDKYDTNKKLFEYALKKF